MTITQGLIDRLEDTEEKDPQKCRIITKARVTKLIYENGKVVGCQYEKSGAKHKELGPVIICTGGYAADYTDNSLLKKYRPDLQVMPTTNGPHCTGDGIKISQEIGADVVDMEWVQVHPTGLVDPENPDSKVKFLAAEALRGVGGIMIDANGNRFCDELGRRDYVSEQMAKGAGPFRLLLNSKASKEIEWHCKHYVGRGLMKMFSNATKLAEEMNIDASKL